ncbi:hypothetical protein [Streptomyces sp. NPDC096142]|uniref:hypothetical protein n=1 Tax=Streptomyces sp. NPDC096142 TaxID=3366077 RepID=UPI0037FC8A73
MSAGEEQDQPTEPETEPRQMSERTAKVILCFLGIGAVWGLVAAFPWIAYVIVGSIGTVGVQKARARWTRTGDDSDSEDAKAEPSDVAAALRRLVGDDKGVLLTVLRDDLGLPDTKAVKALLEAEDIPWKASRTRKGNGPAVRKEAIPPAPSPSTGHTHGDGCCCRSGDNNNANNGGGEGWGEGLRVERRDTDSTYRLPTRQVGTEQGSEAVDTLARILDEIARAQPKPSE